jgi:glycosyltransferase involved in cell wall biosynthesis
MVAPLPLLIISDAVSSGTGLGRIAGELAARADANLKDMCRVATLGYGGGGSRRFKFPQYSIEGMGKDWVIPNLPEVWEDWAGDEPGVILCIWDASRLGWFSRPNVMCEIPPLRQFLLSAKVRRWTYTPIDADGPNGKLSYTLAQSLLGFDRILAYGQWAEDVVRRSLGNEASQERDLGSIPHGIDSSVFYPRDRSTSRANFFSLTGANPIRAQLVTAILDDEPLVGTIATNQARKDWGLWAESCALFLSRHPKTRFWVHTDVLERNTGSSIPQLLLDFGLLDRTVISMEYIKDEKMAQAYSACDLTLAAGPEGFGYCIFESLFCGTPCIHGNYAGAPEHLHNGLLVNPVAHRLEGLYALKRPVFQARDFADKMNDALGKRSNKPGELDWNHIWPRFDVWFRRGLNHAFAANTQEGTTEP